MRLVRVTDEEIKAAAESKIRHDKALQDMVNKPAPTWTVKDIYGKTLSLQNLKGKVVVLNFWFTSCSPCIREMPHLNELVAQYSGKEVVFIAFANNDEASIRAFLEKRPFHYAKVPNSKLVNDLYNIDSWPTSFVIDKEGKIRLAVNYNDNIEQIISAAIKAAL
ncbi:TlpA family protein disulfide reductase [Niastella koreensis]|nr:TlpA disulfide reductase family protein [Niastella koreensis]